MPATYDHWLVVLSIAVAVSVSYTALHLAAQVVRELGVDYAQGYAFGKPEPLDVPLRNLGQDESKRCAGCS